jgi:hypothetical protein
VRWIFSAFVKKGKSEGTIAKILNDKGISSGLPRPWTPARIRIILKSESYIGNRVWNRTSIRLRTKKIHNPPESWFRTKCSFGPVINKAQFDAAQEIFLKRKYRPSKDELLEKLR